MITGNYVNVSLGITSSQAMPNCLIHSVGNKPLLFLIASDKVQKREKVFKSAFFLDYMARPPETCFDECFYFYKSTPLLFALTFQMTSLKTCLCKMRYYDVNI